MEKTADPRNWRTMGRDIYRATARPFLHHNQNSENESGVRNFIQADKFIYYYSY